MAHECKAVLPEGNYNVISIALDLTGKKLIDEICNIAAYYDPSKIFSQYVMPHREISRSATRAYGIRIFCNFDKFRVMKDVRNSKNSKTLKTKSEYSALIDWLTWLKEIKGSADGIILAYHDNNSRNVTPFLLESLERFKLTDEFFDVIKGFVSCYDIAAVQPDLKNRALTLRALSQRFLEDGDSKEKDKTVNGQLFASAKDRAEMTYKVLRKLLNCENDIPSSALLEYCTTRTQEMVNLEKQRELAVKVKSLRPIFVSKIRKNPKDRSRAVLLRRYLIEIESDYETLQKAYESEGKDGIVQIVESTSAKRKKQDLEELVETICNHFQNGGKNDLNDNETKNTRVGEGEPTGATTNTVGSSSESEEDEFEEAKDEAVEPDK